MKKVFNFQWLSVLLLALVLAGCGTAEDTKIKMLRKIHNKQRKQAIK